MVCRKEAQRMTYKGGWRIVRDGTPGGNFAAEKEMYDSDGEVVISRQLGVMEQASLIRRPRDNARMQMAVAWKS